MCGAAKYNPIYNTRQTNMLKKKTEEKSRSSAFFFCISAFPIPLSINTCRIVIKTIVKATIPNTEGDKRRANNMVTSANNPCEPIRSRNRHIKLVNILFLLIVLFISRLVLTQGLAKSRPIIRF